jgi:hypothetical protein
MRDVEPPIPRVGAWYKDAGGELFEVVALDDDDATVEIQHFDGTVEELDMDAWFDSEIEAASPPEDWSGSLDIAREDYGVDLEGVAPESDYLGYVDRAR